MVLHNTIFQFKFSDLNAIKSISLYSHAQLFNLQQPTPYKTINALNTF